MEQGSRTLMIILGTALLLGALVVGFNPAYRQALMAQVEGRPWASPIWKSNCDYYPDVSLPMAEEGAKGAGEATAEETAP